ncbi:MAG: hypothetical protein IJ071_04680 [Ruminococcus sp.]|nr:hypothetical protein [Ruminococcus sp.]
MKKRYILPVLVAGALIAAAPAVSEPYRAFSASDSGQVYGLILKCSLGITRNASGELCITAKTQATGLMAEVGFTDIVLQRSEDGENWTEEKRFGGSSGKNVRYHTVDGLTAPAEAGYYYRAVCTHFVRSADIGGSGEQVQTAENSSRAMWISKSSDTKSEPAGTLPSSGPKQGTEPAETQTAAEVTTTTASTAAAATTTAGGAKTEGTGSPATGAKAPIGAASALTAASAAAVLTKKRRT